MSEIIEWNDRKKTIRELIKELESFEDQNLTVVVTSDEGESFNSVKLVSKGFEIHNDKENIYCALHI